MHIVFILEHFHPHVGGVETLFAAVGKALVQAGHRVTVLATNTGGLSKRTAWQGMTIHRVNAGNRYFFTLCALPKALRLVAQADVVHTTSYNAALPAFIAAKLRGKPIIITFHEAWGKLWFQLPYSNKIFQTLHYAFEQLLLRLPFTRFVAVSEATQQSLLDEGVSAQRVVRIYNGLDYAAFPKKTFRKQPPAPFTITYLGRMGISKGIDMLMQAHLLLSDEPTLRFQYLTADVHSPIFASLQDFLKKHDLYGQTRIVEKADFSQVVELMRRSDAVVIPSYSEGFCYVAVEAGALGVPVIHSGRAALSETVSGQHICMRAFTPQALAVAVRAAMRGQWQFTPQRIFPLEDTVQAYLDLYKGEAIKQ